MIQMYGSNTCHDTIRSKQFLDQLEIPYSYIDVDTDDKAGQHAASLNGGHLKTPTIVFNDQVLVEPSDEELGAALREVGIEPPEPELRIV